MDFVWTHLRKVCVISCALAAQSALADVPTAEAARFLTLSQVISKTIARNPDLQASTYELKAADARIAQARFRLNPEASISFDGLAGRGLAASSDERQATLTLSQVLELGNKRARRIGVATSDRDLTAIDQRARELDVLAEATRRYIAVAAAQERLSLAKETTRLVERTVKAIAARVEAARTPQAELSRAKIALAKTRADERQAESILKGSSGSLASLWGDSQPMFDRVRAELLTIETLASFAYFQDRLNLNPDLVRFASEKRLRESELMLAQSQAKPNLTVSAGVRRFQATGDIGFTAGFSMPLPLFDRNQGAIAEAQIRRRQTDAQEKALQVRLRAQLFEIYQQITSSRDLLSTLQNEVLPMARDSLQQTQYGYDRGRFSYLELGVAQQELVGIQSSIIDTAADVHRLTAEIERLTSEPLVNAPQTSELP